LHFKLWGLCRSPCHPALGTVRGSRVTSLLSRAQVAGLGKALLCERTKVRALSDELEHPLNVHR